MSKQHIRETIRAVVGRVAPAWPLDRFVAVNPYMGFVDHRFEDVAARLRQVSQAQSTMSPGAYRSRLERGDFSAEDIEQVIEEAGLSLSVDALLRRADESESVRTGHVVQTYTEVLDETRGGGRWQLVMREHLGGWLAAHFDRDFAAWQPSQSRPLFAAYKADAEVDRTLHVMGAKGFRESMRMLPKQHDDAAAEALSQLNVPPQALELYLHRLLMCMGGWAAFIARIAWEQRRDEKPFRDASSGASASVVEELLSVLLAFELGLYRSFTDNDARSGWGEATATMLRAAGSDEERQFHDALLLLHRAFERGYQRRLAAELRVASGTRSALTGKQRDRTRRPGVQAAFCIDVRSEVLRRHLEETHNDVETLGFAGFFGFPIEHVPVGRTRGSAQCPVLLTPEYVVPEHALDPKERAPLLRRQRDARAVGRAWKSFKQGAVSCFAFVSPLGLAYVFRLLADALGWLPRASDAGADLFGASNIEVGVDLEPGVIEGRDKGISLEDRIALASGVLTAMSLTKNFARLVVLAGHGSSSTNNPHASGLDCGACGGRSGHSNALVAAAVFNDPAVRSALRDRGIDIPTDTFFLAARHDTTTDEVALLNAQFAPESHRQDIEHLRRALSDASQRSRRERARRVTGDGMTKNVDWFARSRDWAQTRPEWGLAGCAAFLVAPRERTAHLDLNGRAFLHNYDAKSDQGFAVLEQIMTAPMVVASWINLQYFGSTVDPETFGAGNKTLHNVVGGNLGVFEGNTGDLRIGLPWQSVHDGQRLQHEPIRLNVVIEAPAAAMNAVIAKHPSVRDLVDNGWIHLFAMNEDGCICSRYVGGLAWEAFSYGGSIRGDRGQLKRAS